MRTMLSLDDDVAALLSRTRAQKRIGLKKAVNEALRLGLRQMSAKPGQREVFRTKSADLGRCLIGSIDDVAEVLAVAEGERFP